MTDRREKNKSCHAKERMMRFFSPIVLCVFFSSFFSLIWLIIPMISSATSTVRGSCTEERLSDTRRLSSLSFFSFSFFLVWGFDWKMQVKVYDTKYVTVCTSSLLSVCHSLTLASDWSRKRFAKIHAAEVWPMACTQHVSGESCMNHVQHICAWDITYTILTAVWNAFKKKHLYIKSGPLFMLVAILCISLSELLVWL